MPGFPVDGHSKDIDLFPINFEAAIRPKLFLCEDVLLGRTFFEKYTVKSSSKELLLKYIKTIDNIQL